MVLAKAAYEGRLVRAHCDDASETDDPDLNKKLLHQVHRNDAHLWQLGVTIPLFSYIATAFFTLVPRLFDRAFVNTLSATNLLYVGPLWWAFVVLQVASML